jgi:hypothetical protein
MMTMVNIALLALTAVVLVRLFKQAYFSGISAAVFLLVALPYNIFYDFPGPLPNLTVHRLIIVITFCFWLTQQWIERRPRGLPLGLAFSTLLLSALLSTLFSAVPLDSAKSLLALSIEEFTFYIILISSFATLTRDELFEQAKHVVRAAVIGLCIAAVLGMVERWADFNPVDYLPSHAELPQSMENLHRYANRVRSTYPHAILLGYGMAMLWPLILFFDKTANRTKHKLVLAAGFFATGCSLFFSESRGAWFGAMIGGVFFFLLSSIKIKKRMMTWGMLLAVVLLIRPQITTSMLNLINSTWDVTTFKGRSANYRWELWYKAWDEISRTPLRFAIGYGDNAHSILNWADYEQETGRYSLFWSWDNEYAVIVLERGAVGFLVCALFYLQLLLWCTRSMAQARSEHADLYRALWIVVVVYLFMMTNVKVFSPQIKSLFYLATALLLARNMVREANNETDGSQSSLPAHESSFEWPEQASDLITRPRQLQ